MADAVALLLGLITLAVIGALLSTSIHDYPVAVYVTCFLLVTALLLWAARATGLWS